MKLALYYMGHSFKNQVRKLFRSWVAILILGCFLFGILIGLVGSLLGNVLPSQEADPTEISEELPADEGEAVSEMPFFLSEENFPALFGLIVTAAILGVLILGSIRADRNGSDIFLMADVNLLFASPMKPQSVLLFRLFMQMFLLGFAGVYLGFQLPNLVRNTALDWITGLLLVLAWMITLIYSQLLSVLIYTVTSTRERLKRYVSPAILTVVGALGIGFLLYWNSSGQNAFYAADRFFNHPAVNWIPVAGWIKGMVLFSLDGEYALSALCLLLLIAAAFLLIFVIWHIRADFYEDAMAGSLRREERLAAQKEGLSRKREKDRSEKTVRDRLFGSGANMFFTKSLYNRFRFGLFRFFTKASLVYLAASVLLCLFLIFGIKTKTFLPAGLILCAMVIFRAIAGPISEDLSHDFLITVPASPYAKVFWSLLGGTANCALDLLPALLVAAIFLQANPWQVVGFFLLAIALDFYTGNVLLFVRLILPSGIAEQVRQVFSMMLLWIGQILPVLLMILVWVFLSLTAAIYATAVGSILAAAIFFALSPYLIERGRN